jgi:hypothetical protein
MSANKITRLSCTQIWIVRDKPLLQVRKLTQKTKEKSKVFCAFVFFQTLKKIFVRLKRIAGE